MQRIVFVCDEVAELLDKTGADKERKELLARIEANLALIARQGRAFGIHLILATQRPDANILPGQIKNNMNIRICGRADTTLSTIIIGDGRAAEQIPHDAQGRFLMEDAVHTNIVPALFQNEITEGFCRVCDAPSDARVIADFQVAGFGCRLEFLIMIRSAPAAILHAVLDVPKVYTLM